MSRIMVVVEFEVKPQHRNQFIELIKGHAQRSRAEDGCQQFDMLLPQEDQNRVFLVGAWRDQAALERALKGTDDGKDAGDLPTMAGQPSGNALYCRLSSLSGVTTRKCFECTTSWTKHERAARVCPMHP